MLSVWGCEFTARLALRRRHPLAGMSSMPIRVPHFVQMILAGRDNEDGAVVGHVRSTCRSVSALDWWETLS